MSPGKTKLSSCLVALSCAARAAAAKAGGGGGPPGLAAGADAL